MFVIFGPAFGQMMGYMAALSHCPGPQCYSVPTNRETQPHANTHTWTQGNMSTPARPARIPKESPQHVDMYLTVT